MDIMALGIIETKIGNVTETEMIAEPTTMVPRKKAEKNTSLEYSAPHLVLAVVLTNTRY
jgi:hypothetical protein